jgi:YidC/Oxa1 family membrane protein insertase
MNRDTLIGFLLIGLVLIGFSWYNQPSQEEVEAYQRQQDSIAAAKKDQEVKQKMADAEHKAEAEAAAQDSTALFYQALSGESSDVVLKNGKVELTLNTKGGTLTKVVIKDFADKDGNPDVTLYDLKDQQMNFLMAGKQDNIITQELYFTPTNQSDTTVTMTAQANGGGSIVLDYRLGPDHLLHFSLQANGLGGLFAPTYKEMDIEWNGHSRQQEKGFYFENRYTGLFYKEANDGSTDNLSETGDRNETVEEQLDWIAFRNQFFSVALISKDNFSGGASLSSIEDEKNSGYLKQFDAKMKTAFDPTGAKPSEFEMYIGPNDFRLIQDVEKQSLFGKDLDLEQLVNLGWWLFRLINRWFTLYVFDWLASLGFSMGVVLILITLLLKAITFPMVKKSYMSSAKMRVLKPKLDEATRQYDKPEDSMQKQQAMMQMYSQYGVSPLSGCLPMLIQMPIWIAMFWFVPNAIQLRGQSFLWMEDLATYDPIISWSNHIWGIGDHLSLSCLLFCGSNILYSWFTMRQQRDQMVGAQAEQMKMMQWMMYLMPIMFFFMFNDYSSGLNFYYFISLFFSSIIMWTLRKTTNDEKLLAILEARYKENKANPKKQSGLAARLAAMQKQAEELQRQRAQQQKR